MLNNGLSSDYFNLERGVRQGDQLSPYLFVVTIEILAIAIRQNKSIKGIFIGNEETKILQYADDTTAILADTNSATALFRLLDDFKIVSGLIKVDGTSFPDAGSLVTTAHLTRERFKIQKNQNKYGGTKTIAHQVFFFPVCPRLDQNESCRVSC